MPAQISFGGLSWLPGCRPTFVQGRHQCSYFVVMLSACSRPEILKHEMKVFFVKYNDPIYVKLEKLDIMIRLTNNANIAQVLAELKE